jgi:hypothetical protein
MFDPVLVVTALGCVFAVGAAFVFTHRPAAKATAVASPPLAVKAATIVAVAALPKGTTPMSISSDISTLISDAEADVAKFDSFVAGKVAEAEAAVRAEYNGVVKQAEADIDALKQLVADLRAKLAGTSTTPATPAKPAGSVGQG